MVPGSPSNQIKTSATRAAEKFPGSVVSTTIVLELVDCVDLQSLFHCASHFWATIVRYVKGKEFRDSILGSQREESR
jgi:hypothetical protein